MLVVKDAKSNQIPLDYFVDPVTKEPLIQDDDELIGSGGARYSYHSERFWSFMPVEKSRSDKGWDTWDRLQQNGASSYSNDPTNNLGITRRKDFLDFAEFCQFRGLVLDIGCGPQKWPSHMRYGKYEEVTFLGIDPLIGEQPRQYGFIHGLGEFLPFRNDLFDQALFVTSLDHFLLPVAGLKEARRVIKPHGELCVWIGEKSKNAPRPSMSPKWYRDLEIPQGADDPFHFKRFDMRQFEQFVAEANLKIKLKKMIRIDEYRQNIFYKLVK